MFWKVKDHSFIKRCCKKGIIKMYVTLEKASIPVFNGNGNDYQFGCNKNKFSRAFGPKCTQKNFEVVNELQLLENLILEQQLS